MKILIILILYYMTACGPIKVKTESKDVHTVSSGTVHIQVDGNVTITVLATVLADPTIGTLIQDKCNGDQVCVSNQEQTLMSTLTNTLSNITNKLPLSK